MANDTDINIERDIYRNISQGNTNSAATLIQENIETLNTEHANHTWLEYAVQYDNCALAVKLIEMGADINIRFNSHTCALWMAVTKASVDIVKLLLENKANPNVCRIIISALNRKTDKLEVLKLLVAHGVNVNEVFELEGTGTYFTALDWTTDPQISEYLQSVGAKSAAEIRGGKITKKQKQKTAAEEVIEYFTSLYGKVSQKSQGRIVPHGVPITIHVIKPTKKHPCITLFTTGLSSQKMHVPEECEPFAYAELFLQLPPDWNYASKTPHAGWPLKWLRQIAEYPHASNTSLGGPVTIIANDEPPQPLGSNTKMTSWLLLAEKHFTRSDGKNIELFRMTPLHTAERDYEIEHGAPALMRAFDQQNVPFILDPNRPSVV